MRFPSNPPELPACSQLCVNVNIRGYILLKVSLVFFITSALVAISAPTIKNALRAARAVAVANDLRQFASAFQAFAKTQGEWPAEVGPDGSFPKSLAEQLRPTNWERATPIGGRYTWAPDSIHQGQRYRAAIVIASTQASKVSDDRAQLVDLDRILDDGVLETGKLRIGFRDQPVYVLEH